MLGKLTKLLSMNTAHIKHEFIYTDFPALKARGISMILTRLNSYFFRGSTSTEFLEGVIELLIMLCCVLCRCSPKTLR